jgi:hypothetical protein
VYPLPLRCRAVAENFCISPCFLCVQLLCANRRVPGFPATQLWTKPGVRLSLKERRMRSANATKVHRKSGVAKWRDLLFHPTADNSQGKTHSPLCHPTEAKRNLRESANDTAATLGPIGKLFGNARLLNLRVQLRKFLLTLRNASFYVALRVQRARLFEERFGGIRFAQ